MSRRRSIAARRSSSMVARGVAPDIAVSLYETVGDGISLREIGSSQNPPNGSAADPQAGDSRLTHSGTLEFPHFPGMVPGDNGTAQFLAVAPGLSEAGTHALPQNLAFELGENGQ